MFILTNLRGKDLKNPWGIPSPYRKYDILFLVLVLLAVNTIAVTLCSLTFSSHNVKSLETHWLQGIFPTIIVLSIHYTLGFTEKLLFKDSVNSWVRIEWCWHSTPRSSQGGPWAPKHQYYLGSCYKCILRTQLRPTYSKTLGLGSSSLCSNKPLQGIFTISLRTTVYDFCYWC